MVTLARVVNFVFHVKTKRVSIDSVKIKELTGCDVSVLGMNNPNFLGFAYGSDGKGRVELNFQNIIGLKDSNPAIQKEVIKNLAHEVKHVLQLRCKSRLTKFFKRFYWVQNRPWVFSIAISIILLGILYIFYLDLSGIWDSMLVTFLVLVFISTFTGPIFYNCFDPDEKDARKFTREAVKNKEWLEIVKVEDFKE